MYNLRHIVFFGAVECFIIEYFVQLKCDLKLRLIYVGDSCQNCCVCVCVCLTIMFISNLI